MVRNMLKPGTGTTKLLVGYDGSGCAHGTLSELRSSGLPMKAQVVIISVCEIWLPPINPSPNLPMEREMAEYFQKHGEQVERNLAETNTIACDAREELLRYFPDWSIEVEVVSGSPARQILSRAEGFLPHIIVIGERGLSSDSETGLGSTALTVLSEAKCGVRIARLKHQELNPRSRIIVAFDGSPGSMAAIKVVASRSWRTKPEIRLVIITDPFTLLKPGRAFDPIPGMCEGTMEGEENWVRMLAVKAVQLLLDSGLSAAVHSYSGNPRMVLPREAKTWNADAVFVGAISGTSLPKMYSLGCNALAIANRAGCSVEVVRNPGDEIKGKL